MFSERLRKELAAWEGEGLLELSHRGLQRQLIPDWLRKGKPLGARIEESAFGQTPLEAIEAICEGLDLGSADTFLDLGAGAGRLLHAVSARCRQAVGIERNLALWAAGEELRRRFSSPSEVLLGDLFELTWPPAQKGFATTVRWSEASLERMAIQLESHPTLVGFATLGPRLELPPTQSWSTTTQRTLHVAWNPGEAVRHETLTIYRR